MTNPINAEALREMICYYYLVGYCPPEHVGDLKKSGKQLRTDAARKAGMKMKPFIEAVTGEVAYRIAAYQHATREPDQEVVKQLAKAMVSADTKPEEARAYQDLMVEVAGHPGRAKKDNRLHRKKGCSLCTSPCQYGFFTLVSEPTFKHLLALFNAENQKPPDQRNPVNVLWTFATLHLWSVLGVKEGYIRADHLGNLSYCLLLLATAKSRFPFQEKHMQAFQAMNQQVIMTWQSAGTNASGGS